MTALKFKTNIHCANCLKTVSPVLNNISEIDSWNVIMEHSDRLLEIEGDVTPESIIEKLGECGFSAVFVDAI